jgi:hypothetical protein
MVVMVKITANQLARTLFFSTACMFIPQKCGPVMTHGGLCMELSLLCTAWCLVLVLLHLRWHYRPMQTSASLMYFSQSALFFGLFFLVFNFAPAVCSMQLCVLRLNCKLARCCCSVYLLQTQSASCYVNFSVPDCLNRDDRLELLGVSVTGLNWAFVIAQNVPEEIVLCGHMCIKLSFVWAYVQWT